MGAWNMEYVMDHLKGVDVTIDNWTPKNGKARKRHLDTFDLALLMTIAHRQHDEDPDKGIPDDVCVCYGGEEKIAGLARMGTTKLEECRNFLKANNLITYTISAPCPEYLRAKVKKDTLDYVWKLNKPGFIGLRKSGGATVESPPHGADEPATRENQPRHAGTKRTYIKKTTNSSIPSSASAADLNVENKKRAELYKGLIVDTYRLSPEQAKCIGIEGIIKGTKNKRPDDVKNVIEQFRQADMLDRKFVVWVGMLINRFKNLPTVDPASIPPAAELEAQFSKPKRVEDPIEKLKNDEWKTVFNGLRLGELSADRQEDLRKKYDKAIDSRMREYRKDAIIAIVSDVRCIEGKKGEVSFEELCELMPNVDDRAKKLENAIEGHTNKL